MSSTSPKSTLGSRSDEAILRIAVIAMKTRQGLTVLRFVASMIMIGVAWAE